MLRIVVISLFVANLLLLGFQRDKPEARPETTVAPQVKKNTGIPTIHLFSEMMQDEGLLTDNRQCFSLGPFHSSEDKDEVRLLLQEVSTSISERQTEALVEQGYWVFMPPYDSVLEANQALISLQALGLEDIGIIYDGDWKNAISLGYFMRQENAQRRKKSVEGRGYAPMIRVQRQGEPRYWLDYEQPPGSDLIALDMQNRPNDFMQRAMPCPEEETVEFDVATGEESVEVIAQLQEPEVNNQADTETGDVVEVESEDAIEAPPEDAVNADLDNSAELGSEDAVDTEPEDAIETEPGTTNETGPEGAINTGSETANDTGSADTIETVTGDAAEIGAEEGIDPGSENVDEPATADPVETNPENAAEPESTDPIETNSENAVGTGPPDVIVTEPEDSGESVTGEG
uniref:SPOR domain-containing protein n=1 Tax=uncultured bacterium ws085G8 TaxID=1131825 RepID=I1X5C8_9BACT|nr:hypothetical protein ws085G8_0033 [uncultured bacterium ws085G8]